jgi:hypothetical protein
MPDSIRHLGTFPDEYCYPAVHIMNHPRKRSSWPDLRQMRRTPTSRTGRDPSRSPTPRCAAASCSSAGLHKRDISGCFPLRGAWRRETSGRSGRACAPPLPARRGRPAFRTFGCAAKSCLSYSLPRPLTREIFSFAKGWQAAGKWRKPPARTNMQASRLMDVILWRIVIGIHRHLRNLKIRSIKKIDQDEVVARGGVDALRESLRK